jgi:hypothetical protein
VIATWLPDEGVKLMAAMGSVKLKMSTPMGGVSYIVMLSLALPPPQFVMQVLFGPLQDDNDKAAIAMRSRNARLQFIEHPVDKIAQTIGRIA